MTDKQHVAAARDYDLDEAWQQWITDHLPENLSAYIWVEDRDDLRFRLVRAAKEPSISCYAPAALFLEGRNPRDVLKELRREMYVHAAKKAGWPEPPPVPPHHKRRSRAKETDP